MSSAEHSGMRDLPSLGALRAFEAVGRRLSFSVAAEELNVTHGAISKQVKMLEQHLGSRLFKRAGRGIELTVEGSRLLHHLTRAFNELDAAVLSLDSEAFEGAVTVNCMPALAANWLIPRLPLFTQQFPNIDLTVLSAASADQRAIDGVDADLHIVYGRPDWPDKKVQLLKQLELFPVCSPRLANASHSLLRVEDLLEHVLIDNPEGTHWRDFFLSHGLDHRQARRSSLRFQDFSHCLAAARCGHGIAMGDNVTTGTDLAAGTLVQPLREAIRRQSLAYYLVSRPGRATASVTAFTNWLVTEMQKGTSP